MKQFFIIDFDSTFTQVEALDELARISLKNHPNFQAVLFFDDHGNKRNWNLQVQPKEGVNVNNLSKEEQSFYNENSIISKEDVQKFLDRYIPKDM